MKKKNLNYFVSAYKELLKNGDVQISYAELVKYIQKLKTVFSKDLSDTYSVGNVFQDYMDFTTTPMNGSRTITSFENIRRFVMQNTNGLVTMMPMAFAKYTQTLLKACGRMSEITCVLLRASTKII